MYPLYRRNGRMLLGCGLGMLAGFVLIPWAAMGTHEFFAANQHYLQSFVFPAITGGRIDSAVEHELTDPITSDTNSFVAILMNTGNIFFHTPRDYTPPLFAKVGHWLIGGAMTLLTIAAAGNRRRNSLDEALFLGLLAVVVLPIAPVCHPHYYMMMLPLIAAVLATFLGPRGQKKVTSGWIVLLMMVPLSHIITSWPGMEIFRDTGLVTWVAVAFWAKSTWLLWTRQHSVQQVDETQPEYLSATAVFA
jgi:hypothetical protein